MPLFPRRCRRCERVVLPTNDDDDEEALALVAIVAILYLSLSRVLKRRARGGQILSLCLCLYAQLPMIVLMDTCIIRWGKMRKREQRALYLRVSHHASEDTRGGTKK